MAVSKSLTIVFLIFYIAIILYLLLYLFVPEIQNFINALRQSIKDLTKGTNYLWAVFISFIVCFLGSASIGFPVPFPFVLFFISDSIYSIYKNNGMILLFILGIVGGLGAALGELTSFLLGMGTKKIIKEDSPTLKNIQGFGKLILEHPKSMYLYIFLAAALPIPDDPLWIALGMLRKKINLFKCLVAGWVGKNFTTLFYVFLPIFLLFGFSTFGVEVNDKSSVITESLMLIVTLTLMFFILSFNWYKLLEKRKQKNMKV